MNSEMLNAKLRDEYRDLQMMEQVMEGAPIKSVAELYGVSPRLCRARVNTIASEMMRRVMLNTQGDPDHPSTVRFTVEEFTNNPRGCLQSMLQDSIREIENQFPMLRGAHNAKG